MEETEIPRSIDVVGVRFKRAGRIYYFDPAGLDLEIDDRVIVETARGMEIGRVVIAPKQVLESSIAEPLKPVIRKAEPRDLNSQDSYRAREEDALSKCTAKVVQHGLPMKLISAEYSFDGSRLTFYFTSDGRVDFRELLRDLAATFRTRIELRQIGVRDEAKLLGGLGRCGRELCCSAFLSDFASVSIKMAKEQDLPLNPMKISGNCGRLLCCLSHENDFYCEAKQKLPRTGEIVQTSLGPGRVVGANVVKDSLSVQLESDAIVEIPLSEIEQCNCSAKPNHRPQRQNQNANQNVNQNVNQNTNQNENQNVNQNANRNNNRNANRNNNNQNNNQRNGNNRNGQR